MNWSEVLENVGVSGLAIGAITFLAKSIFDRWFARDLKEFEAKLTSRCQIEVERFKAVLAKQAFEGQTVFLQLHQKRLEIVQEIHCLLLEVEAVSLSCTVDSSLANHPVGFDKFVDVYLNLTKYFRKNSLYLSEGLCGKLDTLFEALGGKTLDRLGMNPASLQKNFSEREQQITLLKHDVEQEFRNITGAVERVSVTCQQEAQ